MPEPKKSPFADRYVNREYSWLKFNERVLEEAANERNPLLERLKFLAIFESNLDEFYMVRVSGLIEQFESGIIEATPDGFTPSEQLDLISREARPLRAKAGKLFESTLRPQLIEAGIEILDYSRLTDGQKKSLRTTFRQDIFPLCTPLLLHPAPSLPFISNRSLNLAVLLEDGEGAQKLARVKIPTVMPRAIRLNKRRHEYVLMEDIIRENLHFLFPGVKILGAHMFRVIRDADVEIRLLEAEDLIETIEESLRRRRFGDPVLLEAATGMPKSVRKTLMKLLCLEESDVFDVDGLIGLDVLWEFTGIDKAALHFPNHVPYLPDAINDERKLLKTLQTTDILLHHPYDSFRPVQQFVNAASTDKSVIGIKQTLYRVGSESPIVEALLDAAEEGKQVAAMVELKARFDESNNLVWARALERGGAHVSYGFPELKTHSKLCLIVRREPDGIRSYVHVGTGNYNPSTARLYTDLGLFTSDEEITQDVVELFNFLTGFSKQTNYRKLLVAPFGLRQAILNKIHREIDLHRKHGGGRLIFKQNAVVDGEIIDALYDASQAGVQVDLICRGICCLRPGVTGLSENIRVISIVGRFLEHSRILYFANGGTPEAFIGSADLMRRNLDRRVEVLTPVQNPDFVAHLRDGILEVCLKDNCQAWELKSDGKYVRRQPRTSEGRFSAQEYLMANPTTKILIG
ncbi:MAG: polyphosphate kinase 1 [Fimbriimonadaceae bacterium]|nr:polyphosphate kinase 1 [Fimbriimonadaceae bacterium]